MCPPAFPRRGKRPQKGDSIECDGDNIECCAVQQQADAAHRSARRGGRRGNLKDEIHSVVGQKTRGFCSCPKVPGNSVVMIIGRQQEGGESGCGAKGNGVWDV